jgi:ribosome-associated protein
MMETNDLQHMILVALDDLKAHDVRVINVSNKTSITDVMIVASGTSNRHVKALADNVIAKAKQAEVKPLGVEGERDAEWVLVDLNDVIVHVMLPRVRDFYNLERLWTMEEPLVIKDQART